MKTHVKKLIKSAIESLQQQGKLIADIEVPIHIEHTKDKSHGDFACNIAMILAKAANCKPRELAELIIKNLPPSDFIKEITIAGPGFINFFLTENAFSGVIKDIFTEGDDYGRSQQGVGKNILIEFVSANPTGPLHVGHGRGAAYGAAVADLLESVGYKVHREYYVNDAGRQMDILAVSIWLRYLDLQGAKFKFPSNGYQGDYVINIARDLISQYGDKFSQDPEMIFVNIPEDADAEGNGDKEAHIDGLIERAKNLLGKDNYRDIFNAGLTSILDDLKQDLKDFGVEFQEWYSEQNLKDSGLIEKTIKKLQDAGYAYEREGAIWFHSIPFGDDKDRVLVRQNGQMTYFASDIAYHLSKFKRGYNQVIDIMGADHHGYVTRIKASVKAMGIDVENIHILLVQFAILYRGAEKVQMSTRSGSFVTLRELREEVGKDAARFFYILRKSEQHLDFDLDLAKSQSNDNPVYYIQYAHARICSVFKQLEDKKLVWDRDAGLNAIYKLTQAHEKALLVSLSRYSEIIYTAAMAYEPHQLANYLRELANDFHTYYNAHQFIVEESDLRNARLCLIAATRQVIANGLRLLAVSAPEKM